jgi:hypothetical protein
VALPALRAALAQAPTAEAKKRIDRLLELQENRSATPTELRDLRAVQALEVMGTAEAQEHLKELSQGAPGALLTQEAQLSLQRLERRSALEESKLPKK